MKFSGRVKGKSELLQERVIAVTVHVAGGGRAENKTIDDGAHLDRVPPPKSRDF